MPTITTITSGPDGVHLTVRSLKAPRVCAQRAKLPSIAAARELVPAMQRHVTRMLMVLAWRHRGAAS